jgi:hypothetical protein
MNNRDTTPDPEDTEDRFETALEDLNCSRCGEPITGEFTLTYKEAAGLIYLRVRCARCSRRAAAQSAEARDE